MPMAAPKNAFPPNFLVALNPISTGRKVKGAFAKVLMAEASPCHMGYSSIIDCPFTSGDVRRLLSPIRRPPATIAGMMGTKMSLSILMKRWTTFPFPSSFSSGFSSNVPSCFCTSSQTIFTIPEPNIIWNWDCVRNTPFTPSRSLIASSFRSPLSLSWKRSLVAQWVTDLILFFPPTYLMTRLAVFA